MSEKIVAFFESWEIVDDDARFKKITDVVTQTVQYDDPRTSDTIHGVQALNDYVGMFSANAPGWAAKVVKSDTTAAVTRVTVIFGGMGPDGKEMVQYGQYFIETEDERIARMVGFVGTGE